MHLVLATGAPTASGHDYDDGPGQYQYPRRYRKRMQPGTPFVYYRGRRAKALGLPGPGYFAAGVVGEVLSEGNGLVLSEVVDVVEFASLVPIKDAGGDYFEHLAAVQQGYWRSGVRAVEAAVFARILSAADAPAPAGPNPVGAGASGDAAGAGGGRYGFDAAANAEVERYAVEHVLGLLRDDYGTAAVEEMPRNNKGYDIRVATASDEIHVEVKGTRSPGPVFLISEGERLHSRDPDVAFMLVVVHAIDLKKKTHKTSCRTGPVAAPAFALKPRQWEARLLSPQPWPDPT